MKNSDQKRTFNPHSQVAPILEIRHAQNPTEMRLLNRGVMTIGSRASSDVDIIVPEARISRIHCRIEKLDGLYYLVDCGSTYGTFVNHERIHRKQLLNLDVISLGESEQVKLIFHLKPLQKATLNDSLETRKIGLSFSKKTFEKLRLLLQVSQVTQSTFNLKEILNEIVGSVIALSNSDRGFILLKDDRGDLAFKVSQTRPGLKELVSEDISWGVVNNVIKTGKPKVAGDVQSDHELRKHDSIVSLKIRSIMCIPLRKRHIVEDSADAQTFRGENPENVLGVIYVDSRGGGRMYDLEDLGILETMASNASIAISNARLFQQEKRKSRLLRKVYLDTVQVLANSIEARDIYTRGHADRVAAVGSLIAEKLGWSQEQLYYLMVGASLHDIGKIGVPDAILNKKGKLSMTEYSIMKQHPQIGERIISGIDFLEPTIPYLLYHQERFDGSGYPEGRQGVNIPIEARLLAVADVFDALTSNRPYRGAMTEEEAFHIIVKSRGKDFDPMMVDAFEDLYRRNMIHEAIASQQSTNILAGLEDFFDMRRS